MPVKIFSIGNSGDKDLRRLERDIDNLEVQLGNGGMQINNIAISGMVYGGKALCVVHYGPKPTNPEV